MCVAIQSESKKLQGVNETLAQAAAVRHFRNIARACVLEFRVRMIPSPRFLPKRKIFILYVDHDPLSQAVGAFLAGITLGAYGWNGVLYAVCCRWLIVECLIFS
mgnify:CR=1 FL=1